jgi:hypothetical protein
MGREGRKGKGVSDSARAATTHQNARISSMPYNHLRKASFR